MNMDFEVATIGERGQIVIPQGFRQSANLSKGDKFMVFQQGDLIVLKRLEAPRMDEFKAFVKRARERAKEAGLTPKDVEDAVRRARGR